jgi:pimeloyl-ACP methyl ester carboxylesterase
MPDPLERHSARTAPTRFVERNGRRLAYRMIGDGPPLVLCLRLRGVLDVWDPAFLDALADSFTVITFDYSGLGQSTGTPTYDRVSLAGDALDLIDGLALDRVVIGGWSLGGIVAQVFTALHPERTSHGIYIGTVPPGAQPHQAEEIFLPTALKPDYDLTDEYILFFEPDSEKSRAAAALSHERIASRAGDISPPIPEAVYTRILQESHDPTAAFADPEGNFDRLLSTTEIPMLVISGDHDVVFPVENWYALNRRWRSLHLMTFPQAGHGPQHEHPRVCADLMASFVRNLG